MKSFARVPMAVCAVAIVIGFATALIGVPGVYGTTSILVLAGLVFAVSLGVSYFAVRQDAPPASSAFIGELFSRGFWGGSRTFRVGFVSLAAVAVVLFAAGAVALPRGTSLESVGHNYYSVNSGQRVALTSAEAQYLQDARDIFLPIGGAMLLSTISVGLLRGSALLRGQKRSGLRWDP